MAIPGWTALMEATSYLYSEEVAAEVWFCDWAWLGIACVMPKIIGAAMAINPVALSKAFLRPLFTDLDFRMREAMW
jgi:hypothetical protein